MNMPYISVSRAPASDHGTAAHAGANGDYHALFGAEVPFIPSLRSADFVGASGGRPDRIEQTVRRQLRFVSDLANARELTPGAVAFDLRFVAQPSTRWTDRSNIRIFFFGKISHPNPSDARQLGIRLWRKFASHFPLEDPFGYPLDPLDQKAFERWQVPFRTAALPRENLVEVRKYEDRDPMSSGHALTGYYPHSFLPALDFSAMGRFLETLSRQQQPCVASICLHPTSLMQAEHQAIDQLLDDYADQTQRSHEKQSWLARPRERRLEAMQQVFDPLLDQRDHLFLLKIQVIGAMHPPTEVVDALGSELMRNVPNEPRRWARQAPSSDQELRLALRNFHWLEHEPWGDGSRDYRLRRIRYLAAVHEAVGAFRLPIPPLSGFLPGVPVRDEPFVLPALPSGAGLTAAPPVPPSNGSALRTAGTADGVRSVALGDIIHRGQVSGVEHHITVDELNRHALIAGVTGSGKTTTCLHLLSGLWDRYRIPFLVLYPIDKPDYRQLLADDRVADRLLVFTVGDENTAPFRFNPFTVPHGVLLRTHMSRLLRCFKAAYVLADPLPSIYRAALCRVYQDVGWDLIAGVGGGKGAGSLPTLSDFYTAIVDTAQQMTAGYGSEVRGNIRQASEIRIRDLRDNIGHVIDVTGSPSFVDLLDRPVVMELGRLGSSEDAALVMGFLVTLVSEEMESRFKRSEGLQQGQRIHLTLVEEAHRLMASGHRGGAHTADPREAGGEDFSNLLAEVRGYGEGILIAEQIPSGLIQAAVGNTQIKIMHHLEDASSFNLFCDILNLDERQRQYARALKPGEALVRTPDGEPIHVRVANYGRTMQAHEEKRRREGLPPVDVSDEGVARFMADRFTIPPRKNHDHVHVAGCWANPKACSHFTRIQAIPSDHFEEDTVSILSIARDPGVDQKTGRIIATCTGRVRAAGFGGDPLLVYCYLYRIASQRRPKYPLGQRYPPIHDAITRMRTEAARSLVR